MPKPIHLVVLGLSLSSAWGNGHATTYRCLLREFAKRGHRVTFLERDVPWYAAHRDLPCPDFCELEFYQSLTELKARFTHLVREADWAIVGSYVPEGVDVGTWALELRDDQTAFYDIDTPVTLAKLRSRDNEYLSPELVRRYPLYLSFAGGPTLATLKHEFGSPRVQPLYCSFDPEGYFPEPTDKPIDLGYLGTYSDDRQPTLERLLIKPALLWSQGSFCVAGPQYPSTISWPKNVVRAEHIPPARHREFYNGQRFTLNVTREAMVRAGYSPSVRLFEAAACGVPIISDDWPGLDTFFSPTEEILISHSAEETLSYIQSMGETARAAVGARARQKVLQFHTAVNRAAELEKYLLGSAANLAPA